MKARHSYLLLFLLPSAMVAFIAMVFATGAGAGILWLFVYGDNPWPPAANYMLMAAAIAVCLVTLVALSYASYSFGKRRESLGGLKWPHAALAAGAAILLSALMFLHQLSVGNIGPQSDNALCSETCLAQNFRSSSIQQDRTCRCYGTDGRERWSTSMDRIRAEDAKRPQ